MNKKLRALTKINEKISEIQDMYNVKMNSEEGFTFNFDIPNDETEWIDAHELGENTMYKRIKLFNFDDDTINLLVFYGKKGSHVKKHNHEQPHIIICIEGYIKMSVNDENFIIKKGQSIHVNNFQWHSIDFIEASKIIIVYI